MTDKKTMTSEIYKYTDHMSELLFCLTNPRSRMEGRLSPQIAEVEIGGGFSFSEEEYRFYYNDPLNRVASIEVMKYIKEVNDYVKIGIIKYVKGRGLIAWNIVTLDDLEIPDDTKVSMDKHGLYLLAFFIYPQLLNDEEE
jgi:hypothetical protein